MLKTLARVALISALTNAGTALRSPWVLALA